MQKRQEVQVEGRGEDQRQPLGRVSCFVQRVSGERRTGEGGLSPDGELAAL